MQSIVLALASAVMYGVSDFLGGVLGRRTSVWSLAVVTQVAALVVIGIVALAIGGRPEPMDWTWGATSGIGIGAGTAFLYRGFSSGRIGVVAPLSAVGAALLPVAVGLVAGERPPALTWVGIAIAFPAIWLVSTASDPAGGSSGRVRLGDGVVDGLLAGLGFGLTFSTLGQVPESAGLAPLALGEAVSIVTVIFLAFAMREEWVPRDGASWFGIAVGALAAGAAVAFLFATQAGLLTVASVLTSLYPAVTVLLAATILRERVHAAQGLGLVLALAAVALIAAG